MAPLVRYFPYVKLAVSTATKENVLLNAVLETLNPVREIYVYLQEAFTFFLDVSHPQVALERAIHVAVHSREPFETGN